MFLKNLVPLQKKMTRGLKTRHEVQEREEEKERKKGKTADGQEAGGANNG